MTVSDCIAVLERIAPLDLAESWDNVGLLVGDRRATVERMMTCLTLTADVAEEAIADGVHLVVTHHPVLFKPVQRLTSDTVEGAMLLSLIRAGIAIYSPHTAYDSTFDGINNQIATSLGLQHVLPLRPARIELRGTAEQETFDIGSGRWGTLPQPMPLSALTTQVKELLNASAAQFVGLPDRPVQTIAIACGAAAEFLTDARTLGCDALITGEARFHSCLEARASDVGLILAGHYATERPGIEQLARQLAAACPGLTIWASRREEDPLRD